MIEVAIKVSDEAQSLRVKHLIYNKDVTISHEDEVLKPLVEEAIKNFKGADPDVLVTVKFDW